MVWTFILGNSVHPSSSQVEADNPLLDGGDVGSLLDGGDVGSNVKSTQSSDASQASNRSYKSKSKLDCEPTVDGLLSRSWHRLSASRS